MCTLYYKHIICHAASTTVRTAAIETRFSQSDLRINKSCGIICKNIKMKIHVLIRTQVVLEEMRL